MSLRSRVNALEVADGVSSKDPWELSLSELCREVARTIPAAEVDPALIQMVRQHVPEYGKGLV